MSSGAAAVPVGRLLEDVATATPRSVRLRDAGTWFGGGTPSKSNSAFWRDGTIPWISPKDMGGFDIHDTQDHVTPAAIQSSAAKIVPRNSVAIVVRSSILDKRLPVGLLGAPMALNQDLRAVQPHEELLDPVYLAHVLRSREARILRECRTSGGSVTSIDSTRLLNFEIPVPPLDLQYRVRDCLEQFRQLGAELGAELGARVAQFEHYREAAFTFDTGSDTVWLPLSELGSFVRGRRFTKVEYVDDGVECLHYGDIYTAFGTTTSVGSARLPEDRRSSLRFAMPGDLVVVDVGETVDDVGKAVAWLGPEPVAIHDHCYAFQHGQNPVYLSFLFQSHKFRREKAKYIARTKVKTLLVDGFSRIVVPVPGRERQDEIAASLSSLEALATDVTSGLPAEIAARRKQYEYYRDRLLAFEPA